MKHTIALITALLMVRYVANSAKSIRACVLSTHRERPVNCPSGTMTCTGVSTEVRGRRIPFMHDAIRAIGDPKTAPGGPDSLFSGPAFRLARG